MIWGKKRKREEDLSYIYIGHVFEWGRKRMWEFVMCCEFLVWVWAFWCKHVVVLTLEIWLIVAAKDAEAMTRRGK